MKKVKLFFCFSLFIFHSSCSFAQSWFWGVEEGSSYKTSAYANAVASDKKGNAYVTGEYSTVIIFGTDTLKDITDNAYLVKYNSSGKVIWAVQVVDNLGSSVGNSVVTDKSGNIYVTGSFDGNALIGSYMLTCGTGTNLYNVFVAKYDSNGTALWAKQCTTPNNSSYSQGQGYSLATDKYNNVFITGIFKDSVYFGSSFLHSVNSTNPYAFLVKYDSNGNLLWANQSEMSTGSGSVSALSVATDNAGNAYMTGGFSGGTVTFGSKSLTAFGNPGYLVKYSALGNALWAKESGGGTHSTCEPNAVITDKENNPYITGAFYDSVKFGSQTLRSVNAASSIFLTKYDTNGNPVWAVQSSPDWNGASLATDAFNRIYMTGITDSVNATLTFGGYSLTSSPTAAFASFLMEFDTAGYAICGSMLNNLLIATGNAASDSTGGYIYTTGTFIDSLFCGPDTLVNRGGGLNTFLGRWQHCGAQQEGINPITSSNLAVTLFPNPNGGVFTIQLKSEELRVKSCVEIYNVLGEKVYSRVICNSQFVIDLNQPSGIYLYRILNEEGSVLGSGKIIVQK